MITPQEITRKARSHYRAFLRSALCHEPFFPLEIPFGKPSATTDYATLRHWVEQLQKGSKSALGYGYTVELRARKMQRYGQQSLPERIYIESEMDFLRLIQKQREAGDWRKRVDLTREQLPQLETWISKQLSQFLAHLDDWPELLLVCQYFMANPRPQLYMRELPIRVHTKFIETHQPVLRSLLEFLIPADAFRPEEMSFERRFFLRYDEPVIRCRLLDARLQQHLGWPADDLSVPLSQAATWNISSLRVFIIENRMNFLTFPSTPDGIALWGSGFHAANLREWPWLHACHLWYWGDLDAQGFEILSQVRRYFAHTRSLMMNEMTWERYQAYAVAGTPTTMKSTLLLTPEEYALYQMLTEQQLRLEQEHIEHVYVCALLATIGQT
jgi:hypothetical protein